MKGPLFYSKILLFGEYGIIKDSKGLSIPYNFYNGALKKDENPSVEAIKSNESLKQFANHIQSIDVTIVRFDNERLQEDVNSGMYFDSSIPQGYGVGSSGALVAALYDKYAFDKITVLENLTREKLLKLKSIALPPSVKNFSFFSAIKLAKRVLKQFLIRLISSRTF